MNIKHIILPTLLLAASAVSSQDLNKEITIDRDIVPAKRAAARPMVFPFVTPPTVTPVTLRMAENSSTPGITPGISPYEPAADNGAFPLTPWRGYVDLGYFPTTDFGVSAGYAIVDKEATMLNIWLQADNRSYKRSELIDRIGNNLDDFKWKSLDVAGGFGFSQKLGRNLLRLTTDAAYSSHSYPDRTFGNLRWHFNGKFSGRTDNRLAYVVGVGVGIFRNRQQELIPGLGENEAQPMPVNETSVNFNAALKHQTTDNMALGIKVEGEMLHFNSFMTPEAAVTAFESRTDFDGFILSGKTVSQLDIIPAVEYNTGRFYGKAGARLGISFNSGNNFHVAPDVTVGVNPSAAFGAWVKLGGGVTDNSLEELYLRSRYADPRLAYNHSSVAFTGQFGVRVGPFRGAALTLTADYAAANDWLMPLQLFEGGNELNIFAPTKIRAFKFGAKVDWSFRSLLTLALSYELNPGDGDDHAWLGWTDRARQTFGASVSVTPISPLTVDVGFTARLDRRQWVESVGGIEYINNQDYVVTPPCHFSEKLGDMTNLYAGASWKFTQALTIFARFENILNKHTLLMFDIPNQGFTGLFGLGYKF